MHIDGVETTRQMAHTSSININKRLLMTISSEKMHFYFDISFGYSAKWQEHMLTVLVGFWARTAMISSSAYME